MVHIKSFVIERAVDFIITILLEDFPRHRNRHCFQLFPAFQYDISDRIPELLSSVYMSRINSFCHC